MIAHRDHVPHADDHGRDHHRIGDGGDHQLLVLPTADAREEVPADDHDGHHPDGHASERAERERRRP